MILCSNFLFLANSEARSEVSSELPCRRQAQDAPCGGDDLAHRPSLLCVQYNPAIISAGLLLNHNCQREN